VFLVNSRYPHLCATTERKPSRTLSPEVTG